jgi:hypothetical protein
MELRAANDRSRIKAINSEWLETECEEFAIDCVAARAETTSIFGKSWFSILAQQYFLSHPSEDHAVS